MKVVIMAGGFGTRLRPLTVNIPKPMVPLANKPMMVHIIKLLKRHNLKDIIVILYHQPQLIKDYFKDGKEFGVKIDYVTSEEDLGTAGAVGLARGKLKETFLVISGDVLTDFNLSEVISFHKDNKSLATITLTRVENPLQYGIVITDTKGRIKRFLEKPSWGEVFSDTINTGIYVLEPDIFEFVPEGKEFDFSKNLFPQILSKKLPLFGFISDGYWRDIGNIREYKRAHMDILRGRVDIEIEGRRVGKIGSDVWVGENSHIKDIKDFHGAVVIGKNVNVGVAEITNSFIGDNVKIEDGTLIENSIIWDSTSIERNCKIINSVICRRVKIRESAILEGDNTVSDDCEIGKEAKLRPTISIWPNKIVEDGAVVTSSLVWGKVWTRSLFGSYGILGVNNVEVTPEFAAKLGCAYGTFLGKGAVVYTGRDAHESSRMIKRALIAGLMATGVDVLDLRASPVPLVRFAIKSLNGSSGLHVKRSPFDPNFINIKFFDRSGYDISPGQEKSIERLFFREEFNRASMEDIGHLDIPPRVVESYREFYLDNLDVKSIKNSSLKFVIDYSYGTPVLFFPAIIGDFGLEIVSLNAYMDGKRSVRSLSEFKEALNKVSSVVKSLDAHFGVLLDAGGEKIFGIDATGEILSNTRLVAVFLKLLKREKEEFSVTLPVNASFELEQYIKSLNIGIRWSSTLSRNIIREASKTDIAVDLMGGFIFSNFLPFFDGMYSVGKLIELLSRFDGDLNELKKGTPKRDPSHIEIPCPWELKGRVMRNLSEKTADLSELIEGVKFREEDGFVFVLPDSDRAVIHIYSSFIKEEKERKRMKETKERIESWIKK